MGTFRRSQSLHENEALSVVSAAACIRTAVAVPAQPAKSINLVRVLELHTRLTVISRARPRQATGAAAYISASRIADERTGIVHDYRRKADNVEDTGLFTQEDAPDFAFDRAKLWNAAEQNAKHPRAQTARMLTVNFPHEFSAEQRKEAGTRIGHTLLGRYGGAVDVAWHRPSAEGDARNYHAHLLFTTRRFENGDWRKTKDRVLDDRVKGPREVKKLREEIAAVINEIATRERHDIYVEHLTYAQRGVEREPQLHLGWKAAGIERRGEVTEIGQKNRDIQARNERRAQLERRGNVIDFAMARDKMLARQAMQSPRYQAFYRESYDRRAALLKKTERDYGQEEKDVRAKAAELTRSIDNAGIVTGLWRRMTGRMARDKEQLAETHARLEEIARERQSRQAGFERDRVQRLEALKQEQQREREERAAGLQQAKEKEEAVPMARAVGDNRTARVQEPERPAPRPAQVKDIAAERPSRSDSRREYFRRQAIRAARQDSASTGETEADDAGEASDRPEEVQARTEPANDFRQAAAPAPQPAPSPAPEPETPQVDPGQVEYQKRLEAYHQQSKTPTQSHTHDNGPQREM